ncbi:MAG TPA: AMP-binding protein [Acidimicrobiales bacterium]|nr:AMP-binding protein [Acidimicrobiales bacterium]
MSDWNYADVWETVADVLGPADAVVQGDRVLTWAEFDRRADGVAAHLLGAGLGHQEKVAVYLYNCPEYLETIFAAMKAALVPVNTNYRYREDELTYLWDNADAAAVVFHGTFSPMVELVRPRVPAVRRWLWVDDGAGPCPPWATPYEKAVATPTGRVVAPQGRSGGDLFMIYTGGTTGMPKGVMWRQDDLFALMNGVGLRAYPDDEGLGGVRRILEAGGPGITLLPACPLMHGTGGLTTNETLSEGGRIVLLAGRHFDPVELLETVSAERVNGIVIVGDPFARPMLEVLDAEPGRYDLSSVMGIVSSGAMWSEGVKEGLLAHQPDMFLLDVFSSSEAIGMGSSVVTGGAHGTTAVFSVGPQVRVLDEAGQDVVPGSDVVGVLALGGRNPLGYYKDEQKSAATFRVIDGARYSIPGDFAKVRADGTIALLGRGSQVINTAGEKVYPEEVEEVLKTDPAIHDAVVVGVPDPRFGEQVVAVVEPSGGAPVDPDEVIERVKAHLAGFKAPRHVRVTDTIGRSPSGKVDYGRHRRETVEWLVGRPEGAP